MRHSFLLLLLIFSAAIDCSAQQINDAILGKWMSSDKNLEVEIFRIGTEYKARVVWFDDTDDKSRPLYSRTDENNPDEDLRSRKIVGLEVLHGLQYNKDDDEWQDGHIYDSSSGKSYNAKAWLTDNGTLKVRGYWHLEFLGQNMSFKKV